MLVVIKDDEYNAGKKISFEVMYGKEEGSSSYHFREHGKLL